MSVISQPPPTRHHKAKPRRSCSPRLLPASPAGTWSPRRINGSPPVGRARSASMSSAVGPPLPTRLHETADAVVRTAATRPRVARQEHVDALLSTVRSAATPPFSPLPATGPLLRRRPAAIFRRVVLKCGEVGCSGEDGSDGPRCGWVGVLRWGWQFWWWSAGSSSGAGSGVGSSSGMHVQGVVLEAEHGGRATAWRAPPPPNPPPGARLTVTGSVRMNFGGFVVVLKFPWRSHMRSSCWVCS